MADKKKRVVRRTIATKTIKSVPEEVIQPSKEEETTIVGVEDQAIFLVETSNPDAPADGPEVAKTAYVVSTSIPEFRKIELSNLYVQISGKEKYVGSYRAVDDKNIICEHLDNAYASDIENACLGVIMVDGEGIDPRYEARKWVAKLPEAYFDKNIYARKAEV